MLEEPIDDDDVLEGQTFTFLPRKRKRTAIFRHVITPSGGDFEGDFDNSKDSDSNSSTEDDERDVRNDAEFSNNFEDYSHPVFDLPTTSELPKQDRTVWILIWIMKFRSNFKLPDTATEALIKFIRILLEECGGSEYESFPKSLYLARQTLGLVDQFTCFAACQKCHKLYKKDDVANIQNQTIIKYSYVEFPNSATKRFKQC